MQNYEGVISMQLERELHASLDREGLKGPVLMDCVDQFSQPIPDLSLQSMIEPKFGLKDNF